MGEQQKLDDSMALASRRRGAERILLVLAEQNVIGDSSCSSI